MASQSEIIATVRTVKSIKEPQAPSPDLGEKINKLVSQKWQRQRKPLKLGTLAAGIIVFLALILGKSLWGGDVVLAMEKAVLIKISPSGGDPYHLWIDVETNLPLQLRTAVQNALQTTYTFVSFKPNVQIQSHIFTLKVPDGYQVIEEETGQLVYSLKEASEICGFVPVTPHDSPHRIYAFAGKIVFDYGKTTIVETPAEKPFKIAGQGAWGQIDGQPVEIIQDRLRWQQQDLEIIIEGPQSVKLARQLAPNLILPDKNLDLAKKAQVKVEVNMEIAQAEQKQVDAGHAPWQLDPLFVSHVFVNLQVTPEGIVGEPKIPYSTFKIEANTGVEALVSVGEGPIRKIYLKKLVREDESGIWSVIGYDSSEDDENKPA